VELTEFSDMAEERKGRIGHAGFFAATFDALSKGKDLPVTGKQARHNLAIIEAARQATVERRAIEVP